MKYGILSLFLLGIAFSATSQITNNDFENWTQLSVQVPLNWPLAIGKNIKSSDAHSGNFALRLESDTANGNQEPGVIFNGNSNNGSTFFDGFPMASKPDSLVVWLKYNVAPGDTAMIFVFTKKAGITLSKNVIKITQFANGYARKAFKLNYIVSGQTPDSAILGFTNTYIYGGKPNPASWMQIDDISFSGTTQNVPNPGFENWGAKSHYLLNGWINNYDLRDLRSDYPPQITRTTDKATGTFAMIVQNTVNKQDTITGYTRTGTVTKYVVPGFKMPGRVDTLYGLYKWIPENGDSFSIDINCYKLSGSWGGGYLFSGKAQNTYSIFKIPISYFDGTIIPDSGTISIYTAFSKPKGNSKLYIDNLNFNPVYGVGTDPVSKTEKLIIYPNPAMDQLRLILPQGGGNYHAVISDVRGVILKTIPVTNEINTLDISEICAGIYNVSIAETAVSVRFVKK